MGYQSKTYSLSDEVVAVIEAAKATGVTPNRLLMAALKVGEVDGEAHRAVAELAVVGHVKKINSTVTVGAGFDPSQIEGVRKGVSAGFACRCVHSGCRGSKFTGTSRFQSLCSACQDMGHAGDPRECGACFDDTGPA